MNAQRKKSDAWYIPPDVAVFVVQTAFAIGCTLLFSWLMATRQGDPTLLWITLAAAAVGVVLLFLARLPLYRRRRFFSIGPRELDERSRRLYFWAYRCIAASIILFLLQVLVLR